MKDRCSLRLTITLAAAVVWFGISGLTRAEESATVPTDPGFNANTGQINPGVEQQPPSQSKESIDIPTPEESRRRSWSRTRSNRRLATRPMCRVRKSKRSAGQIRKKESQNATGGPEGLTTGGSTPDPNASKAGGQVASTSTNGTSSTAGEPPPSGPIGSFGQTIPAKFSKRNDILDRTPIMAWPLPLSDQQRMQIFDAVMSDASEPVAGADALTPASELSPDQALNGMRPLPESVRSIDGVEHLYYLKAKRKVLLVEPATRTVVGEIKS